MNPDDPLFTAGDDLIRIDLEPRNKSLAVQRGEALQDVLFAEGVEFPCGGHGRCKGCKVKVLEGDWPAGPVDQQKLSRAELEEGWRLVCQKRAESQLKLELAQWAAPMLADETTFEFTPEEGFGVAVDVGTTTLVAQLVDLRTGQVRGVRAALNAQARFGADVMSRIDFALSEEGREKLQRVVRDEIYRMVRDLVAASGLEGPAVKKIVLAGNTIMHHLFCGIDLQPLAQHPFHSNQCGLKSFCALSLGWSLPGNPGVHFLPCLGGFVGSDILAGVLATRMHESDELNALIDLGTNGEIVIGNRSRLICASTAAGPAFEGARISMGMRAATGAIFEAKAHEGGIVCRVIGNTPARGICGSGLVDAVAAGLGLGWIQPSGRLVQRQALEAKKTSEFPERAHPSESTPVPAPRQKAPSAQTSLIISGAVRLTQNDIRELQLAKGAMAAGIRLLLKRWGAAPEELSRIYLAGAFGNYINKASAQRIGMLNVPPDRIHPAGNTALLGAKLALFNSIGQDLRFGRILSRIEHVSLADLPEFQEVFVEALGFK
jgi:uncharacterized 2Fe-2S/4Fe-4S cluster protein (DUF4445 family)